MLPRVGANLAEPGDARNVGLVLAGRRRGRRERRRWSHRAGRAALPVGVLVAVVGGQVAVPVSELDIYVKYVRSEQSVHSLTRS